MSPKVKNILRNIGFFISVPLIIGAFVFARKQDMANACKGVSVHIINPSISFLNGQQVENIIMDNGVVYNQSKLNEINIQQIEESLNKNPWVKKAEIFIDAKNNLNAHIEQHSVAVRVQRQDSSVHGFFLNEQAEIIPLSKNYFPLLPVVTTEKSLEDFNVRKDIVSLAKFIRTDTFWDASISQINYDKNGEIELVSVIGDAPIRFGTIDDMEDKFQRLFQFYKNGIARINWKNVKELDLRFKKQLVCRRYHKEASIEEKKAPVMYAKRKAKPLQKKVVAKKVTKKVKAQKTAKVSTKVASNVATKKQSVRKESKPVKQEKKLSPKKVVAQTTPKKKKAAAVVQEVKKKVKKKKQIIINSEPVTKKK